MLFGPPAKLRTRSPNTIALRAIIITDRTAALFVTSFELITLFDMAETPRQETDLHQTAVLSRSACELR